jgi:hypothetical protein
MPQTAHDVLISKTAIQPFRFVQRKCLLPIHTDEVVSIIRIIRCMKNVRLLQGGISEVSSIVRDKILRHHRGGRNNAVADITLALLVSKYRIALRQLEKPRGIEFSVPRRNKSKLSHVIPIAVRVMSYVDIIEAGPWRFRLLFCAFHDLLLVHQPISYQIFVLCIRERIEEGCIDVDLMNLGQIFDYTFGGFVQLARHN